MADTFQFRGAVATPMATMTTGDEVLLTIENQVGSGVQVRITGARFAPHDQSQQYMIPGYVGRTGVPSGGNTVTKTSLGSVAASSSGVVVRASRTTDTGTVTAITLSSPVDAWRTWTARLAGALQVLAAGNNVPAIPQDRDIILNEGEAFFMENAMSASPNAGVNSNRRVGAQLVWEEWIPDAGAPPEDIPASDSFTFAEDDAIAISGAASDSGVASEAASISATLAALATDTTSEAAAIAATLAALEAGYTLADAAALAAALAATGTHTHADGTPTIQAQDSKAGSDSGSLSDAGAAISAATAASDAGSLSDAAAIAAQLIASAAAAFSDSGAVLSVNAVPVWEEFRQSDSGDEPTTQSVRNEDVQALTNHARPTAAWRPFRDRSPFNKPIPAERPLYNDGVRDSPSIIGYLVANRNTRLGDVVYTGGGTPYDYAHPWYFAKNTDDACTLVILSDPANGAPGNGHPNYGTSPINGDAVYIPHAALPAGSFTGNVPNNDGHMHVVQPNGQVLTCYKVQKGWTNGGNFQCRIAAYESLTGDGLTVTNDEGSTAARFAGAPMIRNEDLAAGIIEHAAFVTTYRTRGWVYPSSSSGSETTDTHAPPMGARLRYGPDATAINAKSWPTWLKDIAKALHKYGVLIGDTGGDATNALGIQFESDVVYRSFPADYSTIPSETWGASAGLPSRVSGTAGRTIWEMLFSTYDLDIADFEVMMPESPDDGVGGFVSISAAVGVSDALTHSESPAITAAAAVTDLLTHSEAVLAGEFANKVGNDSWLLTEAAALANATAVSDTVTVTEALTAVSASLAASDPHVMVEAASLLADLSAAESHTHAELAQTLQTASISASDAVALSESAALATQIGTADALVFSDLASVNVVALKTALDSWVFSEATDVLFGVPSPQNLRLPLTAAIISRAAVASVVKHMAVAAIEARQSKAEIDPQTQAAADVPGNLAGMEHTAITAKAEIPDRVADVEMP